jgi:hypothetical protein
MVVMMKFVEAILDLGYRFACAHQRDLAEGVFENAKSVGGDERSTAQLQASKRHGFTVIEGGKNAD